MCTSFWDFRGKKWTWKCQSRRNSPFYSKNAIGMNEPPTAQYTSVNSRIKMNTFKMFFHMNSLEFSDITLCRTQMGVKKILFPFSMIYNRFCIFGDLLLKFLISDVPRLSSDAWSPQLLFSRYLELCLSSEDRDLW